MPQYSARTQRVFYPQRRSMRLEGYDYQTAGAYAMTICAHDRYNNLFDLPAVRNILKEEWNLLPQRFVGITLDDQVIMPDHLHCIIWHNGRSEKTKSIIDVIKGYKSICAVAWLRYIKASAIECSGQLWQKNFYDHIIRNEKDLENQRIYMKDNPRKALLKKGKTAIKQACEYNSCGHIPYPLDQ